MRLPVPQRPDCETLPELDVLLVPITPALSPLLFCLPLHFQSILLFPRPPPSLLLCLNTRTLLLHELLCLFYAGLFLGSVVLAYLVGHDGDATPGCYGPVGGCDDGLYGAVSTLP